MAITFPCTHTSYTRQRYNKTVKESKTRILASVVTYAIDVMSKKFFGKKERKVVLDKLN